MHNKNENNKQFKSRLPENIQEAKLALEILSFYKPNLIKTNNNGHLTTISRQHPAMLHILMYAIFAVLPILIISKNISELLQFAIVYYIFLLLLIWNITRKTKKITFNTENNNLEISNLDYFGMLIRPKQLIPFKDIKIFTYKVEAGRFGKNNRLIIEAELALGKKKYLFDLAYENTDNENGKIAIHCINILTNK